MFISEALSCYMWCAGENIMIDARSGDCVHVDFSCLFDRGLILERPELVRSVEEYAVLRRPLTL